MPTATRRIGLADVASRPHPSRGGALGGDPAAVTPAATVSRTDGGSGARVELALPAAGSPPAASTSAFSSLITVLLACLLLICATATSPADESRPLVVRASGRPWALQRRHIANDYANGVAQLITSAERRVGDCTTFAKRPELRNECVVAAIIWTDGLVGHSLFFYCSLGDVYLHAGELHRYDWWKYEVSPYREEIEDATASLFSMAPHPQFTGTHRPSKWPVATPIPSPQIPQERTPARSETLPTGQTVALVPASYAALGGVAGALAVLLFLLLRAPARKEAHFSEIDRRIEQHAKEYRRTL